MGALDNSGFSKMSPADKALEFEACERDPHGYAAQHFQDPDQTTQLRVVQPTTPSQGNTLPQRGRHKKG